MKRKPVFLLAAVTVCSLTAPTAASARFAGFFASGNPGNSVGNGSWVGHTPRTSPGSGLGGTGRPGGTGPHQAGSGLQRLRCAVCRTSGRR